MIRTGRVGYVCTLAKRGKAGSAAAPAVRCSNQRRWSFMVLFISSREKFHTDGQTAELEESLLHGSAFFAQVPVSGANKNPL
jgi:hypothetical protein